MQLFKKYKNLNIIISLLIPVLSLFFILNTACSISYLNEKPVSSQIEYVKGTETAVNQDTATDSVLVTETQPEEDTVEESTGKNYAQSSTETTFKVYDEYPFITAVENGPVEHGNAGLGYSVIEKSITAEDMDGFRKITAAFPYFIHEDDEEIFLPANNAILDEYVIYAINDFVDVTNEQATAATENTPGPFDLEINYNIEFASNRVVSVLMHYYSYTGGAHPITMYSSFNYDIEERKQILFYGGMFKDGYDFLKFLSDYCYQDITKQYSEAGADTANFDDIVKEGTDPSEPMNFENFYFTDESLVVHFNPYEVGPYSAGHFEVNIPYEEFQGNILYP